ncbi:unnamed protein product, partial [Bubo scandiacus]
MPASSKTDPPLAKVEPSEMGQSTTVTSLKPEYNLAMLKDKKKYLFLLLNQGKACDETLACLVQRLFKVTLFNTTTEGRGNGDIVSSKTTIRVHWGVKHLIKS